MKKIAFAFLLIAAPAAAQPANVDANRAIIVLQAQRNAAMDQAALAQARADQLADDLAKAQARIKELEPKPPEPDK